MDISNFVDSTITKETVFPSREGFGTPLFVATHSLWSDLVKSVSSTQDLTDLSVPTYHPVYRACAALFGQNEHPKTVLIGKRSTAATQVFVITPKTTAVGYVYRFQVQTPDGVEHAITYTVQAGDTLTVIGAALATAIDALTDITATASVGVVTATTAAGKVARYYELPPIAKMTIRATGTDPGIAGDLDAIATAMVEAELSGYALALDDASEAVINAAAAWTQARKMIYVARTSDSQCADANVTDDIASDIQDAAYTRVGLMFAQQDTHDFREMALFGRCLAKEPGAVTWAHKSLAGITRDILTQAEYNALQAKFATTYTRTNNVNVTFEGKAGDGDFLTTTINDDWLAARIAEDIFGALATSEIVPYTQAGIEVLRGIAQNRLDSSSVLPNPILDPDGEVKPTAIAPSLQDTRPSDRSARVLSSITWIGRLQGAIHRVNVRGKVVI